MTVPCHKPTVLLVVPALDPVRSFGAQLLAKALVASFARNLFGGDILLLTNSPTPLFKIQQIAFKQELVDQSFPAEDDLFCFKESLAACFNSRTIARAGANWIVVALPGTLALRNPDHLFENCSTTAPESGPQLMLCEESGPDKVGTVAGIPHQFAFSPGFWAVRGDAWDTMAKAYRRVSSSASPEDNVSRFWARFLNTASLRTSTFESGELYCPSPNNLDWGRLERGCVLTLPSWLSEYRWNVVQSLFFLKFVGDQSGIALNIIHP